MARKYLHYDPKAGKVVETDQSVNQKPRSPTTNNRPITSRSLRVHPSQVAELNAQLQHAGCTGSHYDQRGILHSADRHARKKACRAFGAVDFDGGFGDAH